MKDLLRTNTSLTEGIEQILNLQAKIESDASNKYLAMAAWLDRNGYANTAEYLYKQAEEEREHFLKVFKYITDMGGIAITPSVPEVQPARQVHHGGTEGGHFFLQRSHHSRRLAQLPA